MRSMLAETEAGVAELQVRVAEEVHEKHWAVGGAARKIPFKRLRSWEAFVR